MTELQGGDRLPDELPDNPLPLAEQWYLGAQGTSGARNPNAMTLVSVRDDGQPSARVVLCKAFVADPGYLVFYTNYESHKARELDANPRVAAVLHWDALGRQIRVEGLASRSPASESDAYFATRGWGSQLGAWGSDQSRPIDSRAALERQLRERAERLGLKLGANTHTLADTEPPEIARPPHWGGYRLWIAALELWAEGADRIHDRARWERELLPGDAGGFKPGAFAGQRLQP